MALMAGMASAAQTFEVRTAEATFIEVSQCTVTQTLITLVQAQTRITTEYPDGWQRSALITVQVDDTCAGVQLLNAAGQFIATNDLAIDRKLAYAEFTGLVAVWDGISQAEGQLNVSVTFDGTGPPSRTGHTLSRAADATLAADGMGVSLRNTTHAAVLSIAK